MMRFEQRVSGTLLVAALAALGACGGAESEAAAYDEPAAEAGSYPTAAEQEYDAYAAPAFVEPAEAEDLPSHTLDGDVPAPQPEAGEEESAEPAAGPGEQG